VPRKYLGKGGGGGGGESTPHTFDVVAGLLRPFPVEVITLMAGVPENTANMWALDRHQPSP